MEEFGDDLGAMPIKLTCKCGCSIEKPLRWLCDDGLLKCPDCGAVSYHKPSRPEALGEGQAILDDLLMLEQRWIDSLKKLDKRPD